MFPPAEVPMMSKRYPCSVSITSLAGAPAYRTRLLSPVRDRMPFCLPLTATPDCMARYVRSASCYQPRTACVLEQLTVSVADFGLIERVFDREHLELRADEEYAKHHGEQPREAGTQCELKTNDWLHRASEQEPTLCDHHAYLCFQVPRCWRRR